MQKRENVAKGNKLTEIFRKPKILESDAEALK